jgi:hypothetical protein
MHSEARAHDEYMGYAGDDAPESCKDCGEIEGECVCMEPLAEAKAILAGTTMKLPTLEHLKALHDHLLYVIEQTRTVEEIVLEKVHPTEEPPTMGELCKLQGEGEQLLRDSIATLKAWEKEPLP